MNSATDPLLSFELPPKMSDVQRLLPLITAGQATAQLAEGAAAVQAVQPEHGLHLLAQYAAVTQGCARKTLAGLLTRHAMAAGVLGLPMVSTLLAAASMLGVDDDEPWDAQVALQNMLADAFGRMRPVIPS